MSNRSDEYTLYSADRHSLCKHFKIHQQNSRSIVNLRLQITKHNFVASIYGNTVQFSRAVNELLIYLITNLPLLQFPKMTLTVSQHPSNQRSDINCVPIPTHWLCQKGLTKLHLQTVDIRVLLKNIYQQPKAQRPNLSIYQLPGYLTGSNSLIF